MVTQIDKYDSNKSITDHLGSTRMVVGSDNTVKETINYYPFGSAHKGSVPLC